MEQAGDVPMEVDASEPAAAEAEAPAVDPAIEAKFARARECRAEGAALWKAGEVGKAMFSWHEVLLNLSGLDRNGQLSGVGAAPASAAPSLTPAQLAEQRDLQLAAHNNLAAGLLKRGKFERALECCTAVLKLEPRHPKALFRRGRAFEGLRDAEAAEADYRAVLALEPGNADAAAALRGLAPLKASDRAQRAKLCAKMFGGSAGGGGGAAAEAAAAP